MSTTNKAFIKAYRQDEAQARPTATPAAASPRHDAAEREIAASARAHSAAIERLNAARNSLGAAVPHHAASPTAAREREKRPLSSFIAPPQPVAQPIQERRFDEAEDHSEFQPGTTVASFQWPAVCRALLQKSSLQFDQVIRLLWARAGEGKTLFGIFSLFRGGGATTAALCLASRAASRGRRVAVGDANFRSPHLAQSLDAIPTAGWEEVLKHSAPLTDAIIRSTDDNVDVLALGSRLAKDPQSLVAGLQASVTAGVLRHTYELSLLDLGTFFDPASQPVLLEVIRNLGVDAAVAITGPGAADPRDIATITEYCDRCGCEFLGTIENRTIKPQAA